MTRSLKGGLENARNGSAAATGRIAVALLGALVVIPFPAASNPPSITSVHGDSTHGHGVSWLSIRMVHDGDFEMQEVGRVCLREEVVESCIWSSLQIACPGGCFWQSYARFNEVTTLFQESHEHEGFERVIIQGAWADLVQERLPSGTQTLIFDGYAADTLLLYEEQA